MKQEIIAAGGSSAPQQRQPVESPDSLVSIAYVRIVDLVSEGEILGLVDGVNSIYLDDTPVATNGVLNFPGFTWDMRNGTQDQTHLPGFAQVENDIGVNLEITPEIPYVRSVANTDLSALRINFHVPRLAKQNQENGDLVGFVVQYAIDVAEAGGEFVEVKRSAFNGKTTGGYDRSERVDLLGSPSGGWVVRVRRITPVATSSTISDAIYVRSVTEIIDSKYRYPNSAVIGISYSAAAFSGVVGRSYDLYGRIIKVPSNYDPETRTYDGVWDGTFKSAYSNNPAWVYYDILLQPRFGLGDRINQNQIDKWGLYEIGMYCDQMVDDGKGGQEPRFTCNCYLQTSSDALRVLQNLSSIFRGISYWGAGQAYVSADLPVDPVYTYTNANVLNGKFSYKGSKLSTRYSVALVSWNDPLDNYKTKVEYVKNDEAIARYGIRKVSITAFACTSQGQAIRAGKWALLTNLLEAETASFGVGLDGIKARPGQVVRVADNDRAGRRIGGRISSATTNSVTVDKVDLVEPGYELTVILPNGISETRPVSGVLGKVISVSPAFSSAPVPHSPFAVESDELGTALYRILGISEGNALEYTITAVKHEPGKFEAVDFGTIISTRPITSIPTNVQAAPTNILAESTYLIDQYAAVAIMYITWTAAAGAVTYDVQWSRDNGPWISGGTQLSTTEVQVTGIYAGDYRIRVQARNAGGVLSTWAYGGPFHLEGKDEMLALPLAITTVSEVFAIRVKWSFPAGAQDTAYTELQYNTAASEDGASGWIRLSYPTDTYVHSGMAAATRLYFRLRLVDKSNNTGPASAWVMGTSSADATDILSYLTGQITETQLGQDLLDEIASIGVMESQLAQLQSQVDSIVGAPDWNDDQVWLEGSLVKFDGTLYRAIQDVPIGTPIENTLYWENIGDYASIGEAVAALTVRMNDAEIILDEVTGELAAQATDVTALRAMFREDDGEGELADALRGWDAQASFSQEIRVRAEKDRAQATVNTQLEASVGDAYAAVQQTQQVVAGLDGELSAMLSIKVGVRTDGTYYGAGMGIGVENTPSGMQSQVLFLADRFAILHSVEGNAVAPFVVQGGQTIMNNAIIGDATINFAKISDTLQSDNYIPNQRGWRLAKNGALELNGTVPGQGRLTINNNVLQVYDGAGTLRVRLGLW